MTRKTRAFGSSARTDSIRAILERCPWWSASELYRVFGVDAARGIHALLNTATKHGRLVRAQTKHGVNIYALPEFCPPPDRYRKDCR